MSMTKIFQLIFKIHEICQKYQPKILILENVSNLLSLQNGLIITKITNMFKEIGYKISYKKLNSSNFSIPQSRERVYIVGSLDKFIDLDNIKTHPPVFLKQIINNDLKYTDIDHRLANKLCSLHHRTPIYGFKLQDKRGGSNNIHSWDVDFNGSLNNDEIQLMNQIMTERRKKHWANEKNIPWMDGMPLTFAEISSFYQHEDLQLLLDHLVSLKYLKIEKCKDLVNGKRVYIVDSLDGYNICKGKLSFPISTILNPDGLCPTLTATDSSKLVVLIDNQYVRKLTGDELKKICGFPVTFQIPDDVDKYDLFGNMVTPPVIVAILETFFNIGDASHRRC